MKFQNLILRILQKLNLLQKLYIVISVIINKIKFKIPIDKKHGLIHIYNSEPWMDNALMKILPNQTGCFIDIGVNLGQTLLKVKSITKDMKYWGFEPNSVCIAYVQKLIDINSLKNCALLPFGLSNKTDIVSLDLYSDDVDQAATIIENYRPNNKIFKTLYVPVFNFSEIIDKIKINKISIIKIDVEGAEKEVLESCIPVMNSDKPFIICEILPAYTDENIFRIQRQNEIQQILTHNNYLIFRFKNNSIEKIKTFGIHSDLNLTNYIFCHTDKKENLMNFYT